jgi:hypothetical protein
MEQSRMDTWTRRFFWGGFAVFLLASIPHIAAYFRHFDPASSGLALDNLWYWGIAYLLAIVIDLSDVLVSIAVLKAMRQGERWYNLIGYWAFICFIMALSWFFNWQYNLVNGTHAFATADQVEVLHLFTIGQINPVIGSAFQVLLLVYTAMAHKFAQKPKTAEELKAEADRLEGLEREQKRIDAYHARNRKPGLIQRAKETAKEVKAAAKEVLQNEEEISLLASENESISASENASANGRQNGEQNQDNPERKPAGKTEGYTAEEEVGKTGDGGKKPLAFPTLSKRSTEPLSVSIKEAAAMLGISEAQVRALKNRKRLRSPSRNQKNITVASIRAYDESRQKSGQTGRQTSEQTGTENG